MKTWMILLILIFLPVTTPAADQPSTDSQERGFPTDYHEVDTDPEVGEKVRKYAEDDQEGAQKNFGRQFVHDNQIFAVFRADRLEYQTGEGNETVLWDVHTGLGRRGLQQAVVQERRNLVARQG